MVEGDMDKPKRKRPPEKPGGIDVYSTEWTRPFIFILGVMLAVFLIGVAVILFAAIIQEHPDRVDVYQHVYTECIEANISEYQCHDLALDESR